VLWGRGGGRKGDESVESVCSVDGLELPGGRELSGRFIARFDRPVLPYSAGMGLVPTREFEAKVAKDRAAIQALREETRRLESPTSEILQSDVTIPVAWLPTLLDSLGEIVEYHDRHDDGRAGGPSTDDEVKSANEMRSLVAAVRGASPDCDYSVGADFRDALWRGMVNAVLLLERRLYGRHAGPQVLRFVAIERLEAMTEFACALEELMGVGSV
jgi:hypothetical protein